MVFLAELFRNGNPINLQWNVNAIDGLFQSSEGNTWKMHHAIEEAVANPSLWISKLAHSYCQI